MGRVVRFFQAHLLVFGESPYTRNVDDTDNWLHSTKLGSNASRSSLTCHRNTFETARLLLRPVTIMDVDAIFGSYAQDEEVARYLIWRPHRSRSETRAYVERCIATPSEVERTYMIVGRDDNVVRGALAVRQRAAPRLDCGYVLARPWWRQGLMTEVLTEVTVWALRQPSVFRIGAVCDFENIGSARVLEKSGFIREGLLRRWLLHPNISDEPRDCYSYARVR